MRKYRVVVCGTTYGQVYLSSFLARNSDFRLAGIVGKGSAKSRQYARHFGVPFYNNVDEVPDDIDIACVVVRATIAGGQGTFIAKQFLNRGIHVIQEHPVHAGDIAACLEIALSKNVHYHVNSHYIHVEPVTKFIDYIQKASDKQKPLFIEATASLQTLYSLSDMIGMAIGGFQPYALSDCIKWDESMIKTCSTDFIPFHCLQGVVKGIPITFKIQNYYNPDSFDNHFLVMHRLSIGTESGNLSLVNTHGPVIWSESFSISDESDSETSFRNRKTAFNGCTTPTAVAFTGDTAPSLSDIAKKEWPVSILRALAQMKTQIETGIPAPGQTQEYLLDLSNFWLGITRKLGEPRTMKISTAPAAFPDPVAYRNNLNLANDVGDCKRG